MTRVDIVRNGLSNTEATKRLERDGPNKLDGAGTVSIGEVLLRQVSNSLTIVGPNVPSTKDIEIAEIYARSLLLLWLSRTALSILSKVLLLQRLFY
jgi:hypothetical protein